MKIYHVYAMDDWNVTIDNFITLDETKAKEYGLEIYPDVYFVAMEIWQNEEIIEGYYIDTKKSQWVKSEQVLIEKGVSDETSNTEETEVKYVLDIPLADISMPNLKDMFCECKSLPMKPLED